MSYFIEFCLDKIGYTSQMNLNESKVIWRGIPAWDGDLHFGSGDIPRDGVELAHWGHVLQFIHNVPFHGRTGRVEALHFKQFGGSGSWQRLWKSHGSGCECGLRNAAGWRNRRLCRRTAGNRKCSPKKSHQYHNKKQNNCRGDFVVQQKLMEGWKCVPLLTAVRSLSCTGQIVK